MADFVISVVGDVLRHVPVEVLKRSDVCGVAGIRIIIVVHLPAKLVVLLPQIRLDKLNSGSKAPAGKAAAPATPTPLKNERRRTTRCQFVRTSSICGDAIPISWVAPVGSFLSFTSSAPFLCNVTSHFVRHAHEGVPSTTLTCQDCALFREFS